MPTYEYKCEKCGDFETWQSIKDNALEACPTCGSKVQRQISANVGFVFKGSGFYQNEYKHQPAPASSAKPSDPVKAVTDKAQEKSEETKPSSEVKPVISTGSTSSPHAGSTSPPQAGSAQTGPALKSSAPAVKESPGPSGNS